MPWRLGHDVGAPALDAKVALTEPNRHGLSHFSQRPVRHEKNRRGATKAPHGEITSNS